MKTPPTTKSEDLVAKSGQVLKNLPTVFTAAAELGSAQWTFERGDDEDAPEVVCVLRNEDEDLARQLSVSSRSEGHGLRSLVSTKPIEPNEKDEFQSFVVTLYL